MTLVRPVAHDARIHKHLIDLEDDDLIAYWRSWLGVETSPRLEVNVLPSRPRCTAST